MIKRSGDENLPKWLGASKVYSVAYRFLDQSAKNSNVKIVKKIRTTPSPEMIELIDALNKGDEEILKGLLLKWRSWGYK